MSESRDRCTCRHVRGDGRHTRGGVERDPHCAVHGDPRAASPQARDAHHDIMTCPKPLCREAASIIMAREQRGRR